MRVRAWQAGEAVGRGEDAALAAPARRRAADPGVHSARMSGESSPWGAVLGRPGSQPSVFACVEPRNPAELRPGDLRALALWEALAPHLPFPDRLRSTTTLMRAAIRERQLPGSPGRPTSRCCTSSTSDSPPPGWARPRTFRRLNALGRACGWLLPARPRGPDSSASWDRATARLRSVYAFPAEDPRQQHLGFLLAWLNSAGDRDGPHRGGTPRRALERQHHARP